MYKLEQTDSRILNIFRSELLVIYSIMVAVFLHYSGLHESVINGCDINVMKKLCNQVPQSVSNSLYLTLLLR